MLYAVRQGAPAAWPKEEAGEGFKALGSGSSIAVSRLEVSGLKDLLKTLPVLCSTDTSLGV